MARNSGEFPLLRLYGLKTVSIDGDGNCLFSSLSDQIYGHTRKSSEIRANVIQHMRDCPDDYKPFVNVEVGLGQRRNPKRKNVGAFSTPFDASAPTQEHIDENYENHLQRMAQGGTYGDNLEIRAFSKAYNTDVRIYNRDNSYYIRAAQDGAERPVAHIAYHQWEHYSSIRNVDGPFTGMPNIKMKEEITAAEKAKVDAQMSKGPFIHEWMIKAVTTSLPHLASEHAIIKALENNGSRVDDAVSALLDEAPSAPGTPGSISQSGGSSIERDPDSDDDEIYGPNKRQNRKIRAAKASAKALRKEKELREKKEAELEKIPSIELTSTEGTFQLLDPTPLPNAETKFPESATRLPKATTQLPELTLLLSPVTDLPDLTPLSSLSEWPPGTPDTRLSKIKSADTESIAPSEYEAGSEYSAGSRSQSVVPSDRPRPKIILNINKSKQKQNGPRSAKKITAREKKEIKKAEQKQNAKERKKQQHLTDSTNANQKRNSPPVEQVIGMKTLYI